MARAIQRVRRTPSVSVRRQASWGDIDIQSVGIGGAAKALLGSLNAAALALRPFTIVRVHLEIQWGTDQLIASESPIGALGWLVVSEQAVSAGAGSIPAPITQSDAPWFVWQALQESFMFITGTGTNAGTSSAMHYTVDSKAMRKVGVNENVAVIGENTSAVGAIISVTGRFLLKLH